MCEIFASSFSSSKTMCQLNECAQPPCQCLQLQSFEMGDIHVYFIKSMAPTHRSEPTELQKLHKIQQRVFLSKIHNVNWTTLWYGWHDFEQCIIDNATDEWCKRLWVCSCKRTTFLVLNLTADFTFVHFNVLVWWKLQVSWCSCVEICHLRFTR